MVQIVNVMLCIFYHNLKKQTESKRVMALKCEMNVKVNSHIAIIHQRFKVE